LKSRSVAHGRLKPNKIIKILKLGDLKGCEPESLPIHRMDEQQAFNTDRDNKNGNL